MGPDREPGRADGGELVDEIAEVLRPVRHGAERVVVGEGCERRPDLLVDLGGEQPERLGARLLGCKVRVGFVRGERAVHARGHLAEPPGMLGQPRRVVAERLERELPAPAGGRNHRGDRRERGLEGRPSRLEHSLQPRGVREPLRGESAEDLELRVRPCLEPAVELEEMKVVEHDGAVRLLDADRCHLRAFRRDACERNEACCHLGPLEGVDRLVASVERDEVVLVRAGAEANLDDRERDLPVLDGKADDLRLLGNPVLRSEPAGARDDLEQLVAREGAGVRHARPPPRGGTRRSREART